MDCPLIWRPIKLSQRRRRFSFRTQAGPARIILLNRLQWRIIAARCQYDFHSDCRAVVLPSSERRRAPAVT